MEVAIIGSGLVGRLLTWRLNEYYQNQLQQDCKITLVDQFNRHYFGTGLIAAAMVAPFTEAVATEAITKEIGLRSWSLWNDWLPQLESQTEKMVSFNQKGTLVVSHPQDDADWNRFYIKAKSVIHTSDLHVLNKSDIQRCEPELAQSFSKALYFPLEGVIDNHSLYPALTDYISSKDSIEWIENTRCDDLKNNGYIPELDKQFDKVFDCRGNGAKQTLKDFRSVRGEVIRVHAPEVNLSRAVRLMHPRFPLYIAPRNNNEYIIGATSIESESDKPVTIRSALELLSALYSLHPGFSEATIIDMHSGLRPAFMDNLPKTIIDDKLISINGLYRHGYLFSPAIIEDIISHLSGNEDKIEFKQFIKH